MKTILEIVQKVCRRVGIASPNTAAGSTDLQVVQLFSLANEEIEELSSRHPWQVLVKDKVFLTRAEESQGVLISDTGLVATAEGFRYIVNGTMWNRSQNVPIHGPLSAQQWQHAKSAMVTGPYSQYRIRSGELLFNPIPPAGETVAFEFVTRNAVLNSDGDVYRANFEMDSDEPLLDDNLVSSGLLWRWKQTKGFAYAQDFDKYEALVSDAIARDGTRQTLRLDGGARGFEPGIMVPAGNWNL